MTLYIQLSPNSKIIIGFPSILLRFPKTVKQTMQVKDKENLNFCNFLWMSVETKWKSFHNQFHQILERNDFISKF